jgi:hypothetical protein
MQISISNVIGRAANLITYAARLVREFKARVATYPGSIFEAQACLTNTLNSISRIDLLNDASLVVTPNAYNETKLYSVVPNTTLGDMDVVRATTATRVNELGLIEIVPRNLLTYSGDFSDASWVKAGGATIALSTIEPPFPNIQTYNLTNIGDSLKYITKDTGTIINASYSFYLKAIDASDIGKTFGFKISNSSPYLNLELTDEWQRIDVFSSTLTGNYFRLLSLGSEAATKVCIAAAQLEFSPTITEYFPTTTRLNIPRLDYTNGSCPSILVEPQRTNLIGYSEELNNATWNKFGSLTISANSTTSPSGVSNADKIIPNSGTGAFAIGQLFVKANSNITYTLSGYAKPSGYDFLLFRIDSQGGNGIKGSFNISTRTISTTFSTEGVGFTFINANITNANNGWVKWDITFTSDLLLLLRTIIYVSSVDGNPFLPPSYTANGTSGAFIWGAQLEVGAYPTSYIPTVASTVTRNADVISKTGISSLIGQTEGTLFLDLKYLTSTNFESDVRLNDGTANNTVALFNSGLTPFVSIKSNNVQQVSFGLSPFTINSNQKIAITYKNNEFKVYQNGVLKLNQLTGNAPLNLSSLILSDGLRINALNSVQLYKTALTNAQLELLTGDSFYTYDKMAIALNYNIQ